jgi:hypothetical protein
VDLPAGTHGNSAGRMLATITSMSATTAAYTGFAAGLPANSYNVPAALQGPARCMCQNAQAQEYTQACTPAKLCQHLHAVSSSGGRQACLQLQTLLFVRLLEPYLHIHRPAHALLVMQTLHAAGGQQAPRPAKRC